MALELKLNYNQSKDGKKLVFQDASDWGVDGNPAISDVTGATLVISIGDVETDEIDLMTEFALNDQDELTWTITSADFDAQDIATILKDGVYTILYEVSTNADDYEIEGNILLYYNVKMGVYKKFMNLNDNWFIDLCNSKPINWATNLWAALSALEYSAYLGNISRINKNLEFVQKLLKSSSLYELKENR